MAEAGASKKSLLDTFNQVKLRKMNELRKKNEFCDLILKSEDGLEIKVHKTVVFSASNYFKDLLTLPMKEKYQESILLPDITADVLEKIITFIYTSEFEEKIEDVEKIIKYAAIFQLEQLVEICSLALSESITDQSCLKYWRLAKNNLIYSLEDKSLAYIAIKADYLFESSSMSDLNIEEMRSLLADKRIRLQCDEKKIFENVLKWAGEKTSETESFSQVFLEIADLFNYAELEQEFILQRIFFNDELTENGELLKKIAKLTKQKYEAVSSRFFFYKPTQRLLGLTQNKMFIGLGEERIIEKEMDLREYFSCTTFDNKWLICGGKDTKSCEIFNREEWKPFPSMTTGTKWGHRCAYLGNKIYVCGGYCSKSVEIYDLSKEEWKYGPQMPEDNLGFGLAGANGALYAFGGWSNNVGMLDSRTEKWNVCCSLNRNMLGISSCVSIGPHIYCFSSDKRCIFDTRSNKFTGSVRLKEKYFYCNYCELDGYIYGFGYQEDSADRYSLNLVQYHLDGKQRLKKSYGLYNETKTTGIVSLYY